MATAPEITHAYAIGNTLLIEHGLRAVGWIFQLDNAKERIGQCNHDKKLITYSIHYLREPEEFIRDTVLHEIAHALVGYEHGHDYVWQQKCVEIGAKPERLANENELATKITPNYVIKCENCGWSVTRLRMRRRNFGSTCPECHTEVKIYRIRKG